MQLKLFKRNSKNLSDEELLSRYLLSRKQDELGELYSRYMHLVYGVCLKYFKDPEKSKDAVINIYEKIQKEIHKHTIKNFKSWLYVVCKNHCLMQLRKSKTRQTISLSENENVTIFVENTQELHPIDGEPNELLEKALIACIEKLKEDQKKCIRLFYYKNKCYREIATSLEIEEKKVKSFIQNGKRNLKICLEGKK